MIIISTNNKSNYMNKNKWMVFQFNNNHYKNNTIKTNKFIINKKNKISKIIAAINN
jgi:hypothetical protein